MKCKECGAEHDRYRNSFCSANCDEVYNKRLSDLYESNNKMFEEIIRPIATTNYSADYNIHRIKDVFQNFAKEYGSFEYNPDFQRGRVWSRDKKIAFIEAIAKGVIPKSLLTITLNCPDYNDFWDGVGDLSGFCIIDGLQRVTALEEFYEGKFKIFGDRFSYHDFDSSKFSFGRVYITMRIFSFCWKRDLLEYYIAINSGGVVHSEEEINRVQKMLEELD